MTILVHGAIDLDIAYRAERLPRRGEAIVALGDAGLVVFDAATVVTGAEALFSMCDEVIAFLATQTSNQGADRNAA